MIISVVLLACACVLWPSGVARSRLQKFRKASGATVRSGLSRRIGSIELTRLFDASWWAPGGALLLLRPGIGIAVLLFVGGLRSSFCAHRARLREREHAAAVQAALLAVVDELRVGAHPASAFAAAADECGAAQGAGAQEAAQTMREVSARAVLGGDVGEGLRQRAQAAQLAGLRSGGALWARLASCWELSHQEGVPMAHVVGAARTDLVERIRFTERTDAALAGARSTAKILAGLPVLSMGLGQAMGADPLRVLVSGPGSLLLALGCGLICAGLMWARRITEGATR